MDGSIREDSLVVKSYLHRSPNRHGVPCEMFTHILVLAKILLGGSKRGGGPPPGPAHGGGKGGPPAIIGGDANEGEAPGFVGTGGGGSGFGGEYGQTTWRTHHSKISHSCNHTIWSSPIRALTTAPGGPANGGNGGRGGGPGGTGNCTVGAACSFSLCPATRSHIISHSRPIE